MRRRLYDWLCPIGPWPKVLVGWKDTSYDPALTVTVVATAFAISPQLLGDAGWVGTHRRWPSLQEAIAMDLRQMLTL